MDSQPAQTPKDDLIRSYRAEIARLHRCITMAMGCLNPESDSRDERLAWYRLFDAEIGNGKEPRNELPNDRCTGGPTESYPERPYCKPDQSCCDFACGN